MNQKITYTTLHGHTENSNGRLLDCINRVPEVLEYAHQLGLNGLAITDHECLSGLLEAEDFLENKEWENFKFIRGNEIYLCRNEMNSENYDKDVDGFFHFILLAKNLEGYKQLCQLSTKAWQRSYKYRMMRVPTYYSDFEEILKNNKGNLIGSTACLGSQLGRWIEKVRQNPAYRESAIKQIDEWISYMQGFFAEGDFYIEIQAGDSPEQVFYNQFLTEYALLKKLPVIVTTDFHYLKSSDASIHKAFLTSKNGDREVDSFYKHTYIMSGEEIVDVLKWQIDKELVLKFLEETNKVAEKIETFSVKQPLSLPYLPKTDFSENLETEISYEYIYEKLPFSKPFIESKVESNIQFIIRLANFMGKSDKDGDKIRFECSEKCDRLNKELNIIWDSSVKNNLHWSAYLLQVADYLKIFWSDGDSIVAPSRGSAGASYVCYGLDIIQIDPTREKVPLLFERFINPDRASILDIDSDIESTKRNKCIEALEKHYGKDHVTRVSTYKTLKAKSAIQTAGRALGYDIDTTRYWSSLIKSDRGIQQSLSQTYFGDIENEIKPDKKFIEEMDKNSNLWAIAQRIEGLKVGYSSHAGGVIISENPITDYCGLMKTTGGDMVTCFDLHEVEAAGLIKIDLLATEALSKMRVCLDLLCENKYIEDKGSLRRTYEEVIGIYNLDRTDKKMWEKVWNNEIIALFQMEQQSGLQGIALTHPSSVEELALLNSVIRLMPADKKATRPLEKFAIFKEDANERILEMLEYGLTEEEQHFINDKLDYSFGIAAHQEDLYALLTSDELGGFSFGDADKLRKAVAKKSPKDYEAFETVFWERVKEKNISRPLANYVWNVLIATQRGYGFNIAHTLSYSLVGLQQMNLATRFPILFWNTANLIIDSGSTGEDFDDINDDDFETAPSDYGKIASAIGKMQDRGINVQPPDINLSNLSFTPVIDTNSILYGMVGIVKVGDSVVQEIMNNRPYTSVEDFLNRVKVNKPQMVNLIKSGAFDCFGNRVKIMNDYIGSIADVKKRLTLQNVATLIKANLIPEQLSFEQRVFFFNKYLRKTLNKKTNMLTLDATSLQFYEQYYDMDKIVSTGGVLQINEKVWKTQYDKEMAKIKKYISENHDNLLITLNTGIINEVKAKYAQGNLAKWSMDSVSFYQKEHELKNLDRHKYAIANFRDLPEEPQVAKSFTTRDGKTINIYQLNRIAGTVIDKNADKSMITLLTTDGVITVLAYGVMAAYDKQISEKQPDGTKKIIESSWFSRGNKIIVNGMRRGSSTFVAKTYANSNTHHFTLINEIKDNGQLDLQEERLENKELEVE